MGEKMAGMALFFGALVLLVLATVMVFYDRPKVDLAAVLAQDQAFAKQAQAVGRIEASVAEFIKAQANKNKELDIVDQNLQARLSHLEGKVEAAQNFKGLLETMVNRPVQVIFPKAKPRPKAQATPLLNKAMTQNPPRLKLPKLLKNSRNKK